jgi:hypothetical protein
MHRRHGALHRRCDVPPGGSRGEFDPCTMPAAEPACVKLGGGPHPYYVEGWFCPQDQCASGFCASAGRTGTGVCGPTAAMIRSELEAGRAWVLDGPSP